MSYILTPGGSSVSYPISIANGGTGATDASSAVVNLTSPAFEQSALNPQWGQITVPPADPPGDPVANSAKIDELLAALTSLGVILG